VPVLLRFVVVYCLFDTVNLVFSCALRGAGDTRFVTVAALSLSWPIMVVPSWLAWYYGWGLFWAWGFATAYVLALGTAMWLRFVQGKWKSMRVIEKAPPAPPEESPEGADRPHTQGVFVTGVGPSFTSTPER